MTTTIDNEQKTLNVPNLRFPEFEGEWEENYVNEICNEFKSGKAIKADLILDVGTYPVFGGNGLRGYTSTYNHDGLFVLIGRQGALCGNVRSVIGKTYITEHAIAVNGNNKSDTNFLHYLFLQMDLGRFSDQSAQPGLAVNKLLKLKVITPRIDEQRKIANLLRLLDERIATQNKINEKLESLIKGISNRLLYADNSMSIRIEEMLIERSERTKKNNQYEILSSTVNGIFSQRDYFSKDIASDNNVGYKIVHLHDIVLSPQNLWMGNINFNDKFDIGIVSPSYKVFSIADGFDKKYVAALLKTHHALYNYMLVSEQGASTVRRNLNYEAFEQLVFKIPSLNKQQEIGHVISLLKSQLENANLLIKTYNSQKQYLLRQMFI
ncbi:MAG: restriction endonuclease subunit S [Prevotella sp.]|nr:restriction endonuclease subunit S [Prevotella sp.]